MNPIEMVWNELKRTVAREVPRTKQELQDCIFRFWSTQMTAEKCATYIDHVFKVVPVCILMRGSATGDVPGKLFNERSRGKSIAYFQGRLADPDIQKKVASFVNQWTVNRVNCEQCELWYLITVCISWIVYNQLLFFG